MSDTKEPILFDRKGVEPLAALIKEYSPGDAGWSVLAKHLATAFLIHEATHIYRQGYEPKKKSRYDVRDDWAALNAVAKVAAEWPGNPLRPHIATPDAQAVIGKVTLLHRGDTSVQIEAEQAAAEEAERAERSARANAAVDELLANEADFFERHGRTP